MRKSFPNDSALEMTSRSRGSLRSCFGRPDWTVLATFGSFDYILRGTVFTPSVSIANQFDFNRWDFIFACSGFLAPGTKT